MTTLLAHTCSRSRLLVGATWQLSCQLGQVSLHRQPPCTAAISSIRLGWQPQQHQQHAGGFASAATADPQQQQSLTLKSALRQLYKRVHPDLFTDYPAEQAENERSFKLLQDYLHQARTPSSGGPASRVAYHFRFYLMPQDTESSSSWRVPDTDTDEEDMSAAAAAAGGSGPSFQYVALSLVPPEPNRLGGGRLSPAALKSLGKLLALCGLPAVSQEVGEEEGQAQQHLTTFLPGAAEVVRQHESGPALHEVKVANIRAALRIAHQVKAGFQPNTFSGLQQVELLQRLASALDLVSAADEEAGVPPLDLSGLRILICNRTALDSQGVLCLDAAQPAEDWADFLGGVDADYARDKVHAAASLRQLERGVAAAVGVRMLFTSAHYLMTHEYRSFLERLAAHAADYGPVRPAISRLQTPSSGGSSSSSSSSGHLPQPDKSFSNIPVYVAPPGNSQQQQQQQVVHEVMGYVMVHMDDSAQQVYNTIQAHGWTAGDILNSKQQLQAELSDLTTSVRSRLSLRRLTKDELISADEFRAACKRLLAHRDLLLRCNIEGLSIRVSDRNRVAADGSVVDIAWNFEL